MKKLVLLPLLALFIASCSTDDISTDVQATQESANEAYEREVAGATESNEDVPLFINSCANQVEGQVLVNYPSGFGSTPNLVFKAYTQGADAKAPYRVSVEFEGLIDCEDRSAGNGQKINYFLGDIMNPDVNTPTISLTPFDVPAGCYRWRFIVERRASKVYKPCTTASEWYESPLF